MAIGQFEVWVEAQTASYWVRYSGCTTKFKAQLIVDMIRPAVYHPLTLQAMADTILRNVSDDARGTFNNHPAFVTRNEKNTRILKTGNAEFFHDTDGKIKSTFFKNSL